MKRKTKNILMIAIIIILIIINILTIYNLGDNSNNKNIVRNSNLPDKSINMRDNKKTPPEKPSGENNGNSTDFNTPPEKPNDSSKGMMNSQDSNVIQNISNQDFNISTLYYILFGVQSLAIAILLMYLIMSKFNKKTLKETLSSNDKKTIYVLSTIILTCILIFADVIITNNLQSASLNKEFMQNGMNGSNNITYSSSNKIIESKEITTGEYSSTNIDENAILVSGDIDVTITNVEIDKTGDSDSGDNTSFYGTNSALLSKSGANLTLKNLTITTNATGANGVFSYGGSATTENTSSDGTTINISDSVITTKKDNSGGIMTTGGGTTNAYNLTITTNGVSSAAIRTDRGGGIVNVDGGTYTTTGSGSPAIYSTAEIKVKNATLVSKTAEGIVVEGKNSVVIDNCNLTDSNTKLNGLSTTYKNIFLYQSMSGDADTGNSSFTATNSKITTNNGDTFYITNTSSTIILKNNTFINNDDSSNFLRAQADSWGSNGSNGGIVELILSNQKVNGNIVIDKVSTLDMTMSESSYYEGTINADNAAKNITLKLDSSSSIKLTGDSYITSLENTDENNSNIDFNGYKLYVNGKVIN